MDNFLASFKYRIEMMEKLAKIEEIKPFDIYFMGGSACILGNYLQRHTLDYDFINIGYTPKHGRIFNVLGDIDILEYEFCPLSPSYKDRAVKLVEFTYLNIHVLSREDIIVSKLSRYSEKDREDIRNLIPHCSKALLIAIMNEILERKDLIESARNKFIKHSKEMRETFHV